MLRKLPIVGVFGQGTPIGEDHARLARAVGMLVAGLGAHLLTGGGYGVMEAVTEAFVAAPGRAGLSIGDIPRDPEGPFDMPNQTLGLRYPNAFVEIAIRTPLLSLVPDWRQTPARNHVNVLTADAIVALPGNEGTRNELDMAIEYAGEAARPREQRHTILFGPIESFATRHREHFVCAATIGEVETHLRGVLATRKFDLDHKYLEHKS